MVILRFRGEQFKDLAQLMDIGGTFLASSVKCERGCFVEDHVKHSIRRRPHRQHADSH